MKNRSYAFDTITATGQAIDEGTVTSLDLVRDCLTRIKASQHTLNAFITILEQDAIAAAALADQEIKRSGRKGPLHGIPIAVKDFYDTKDIKTTAGFVQFKDRVPKKNAVIVEQLRNAGAILLGKTNMDKLGMSTSGLTSDFGPVHNPWNREYITAGSSSGSAASVAAGLCYATVDTDAIGSCRLPAACCGVTGLKVSPGLISPEGILAGEKTDEMILYFAQTGITTRSAADSRIVLDILAQKHSITHQSNTPSKNPGSIPLRRIGIVSNFKASAEVKKAFDQAAADLTAAGFEMIEIKVPFDVVSFKLDNIESDRKKISEILFKDVEALILPTMVNTTPTIDQAKKLADQAVDPHNTMFCNYFGLPAISIPCGFDTAGLPLGLQIVSHAGGEAKILDLADTYEKTTAWHLQHSQ